MEIAEENELFLQDLSQAALDYSANRSSNSEQPLDATIQALCSLVARLDAFSFQLNSSKKDDDINRPLDESERATSAETLQRTVSRLLVAPQHLPREACLIGFVVSTVRRASGQKGAVAAFKDITKARADVINLVANLILIAPLAVIPHLPSIREMCLTCIQCEVSAEPARATLLPLQYILEHRLMSSETFKPAQVFQILQLVLSRTGVFRSMQTVTGPSVATVGLLLSTFPEVVSEANALREYENIMSILRKEWPASTFAIKAGEHMAVVSGCLSALDALLTVHGNVVHLADSAQKPQPGMVYKRTELFNHLLRAISAGYHGGQRDAVNQAQASSSNTIGSVKNLSTHGIESSVTALLIISHHANLFSGPILSGAESLFDMLIFSIHCHRPRIADVAPTAFRAFLSIIAAELSTESELRWMVQQLKAMIRGRRGLHDVIPLQKVEVDENMDIVRSIPGMVEFDSFLDVTAGITGLSLLALPIVKLNGYQEGLATAFEVLQCAQQALTSGHLSIKGTAEDEFDDKTTLNTEGGDVKVNNGSTERVKAAVASIERKRSAKTDSSQILFKRRRAILLSNAVSCYASYIQHLPSSAVDEAVIAPALNALEQLVVSFPSLNASENSAGGRDAICRATLSLFISLAADVNNLTKLTLFTSIVDRFVPAAFMQTLSFNDKGTVGTTDDSIQLGAFYDPATMSSLTSSIGLDLVHPCTGLSESRLLFEYIPFWREIIVQSDPETLDSLKFMFNSQKSTESFTKCMQRIRETLFSALMRQVLERLSSCDLSLIASESIAENVGSTVFSSSDDASSFVPSFDGGSLLNSESSTLALSMNRSGLGISSHDEVTPANKNAYASILSCVEFIRYALPLLPKHLLGKWAFVLVRACVKGSSMFPHFSGFYIISSAVLRRVDDAGFFNKYSLQEDNTGLDSNNVRVDIVSCLCLADAFADEAVARARHSSGELLLASLQLVLLLPSSLVLIRPDRHIAAIHLALAGGASNPALSTLGIFALERFCNRETRELLKAEFPTLLPRLGDILEQSIRSIEKNNDVAGISIEATKADVSDTSKNDNEEVGEDDLDEVEEEEEEAENEDINQDEDEDSVDATRDASLASCLRRPLNTSNRKILLGAAASVSQTMSASSKVLASSHSKTHRSRFLHQKLSIYGSTIISKMIEKVEDDILNEEIEGNVQLNRSRDYSLLQLADKDVSLSSLRDRVILLLAHLGADAQHVLGLANDCIRNEVDWGAITGDASIASALLSGGTSDSPSRLSLNLRFCGEPNSGGPILIDVQLVSVLPRVVTLALSASSRQVKSTACELLHAILSVTIGKIMTDGGQSLGEAKIALTKSENDSYAGVIDSDSTHDESRLLELFSKLFPTCLRLAADGESIAKQLFEPLSLQIVRLFSSRDELPEAQRVVDAVSIALTCGDSALRDFAALCYAEFVKWSIKQHSERTLKLVEREEDGDVPSEALSSSSSSSSSAALVRQGGPLSLEALFRRLLGAARHPNADHRLGACLAWSHIYRTFREEMSLVSRYIFLILDHMLLALRLSASDGSRVSGTAASAAAGVDHCLRIILKFSHLLLQNDARSPQASRTLSELVAWLFTKGCCFPETQARRKCCQLFDAIAPILVKLTFPGFSHASVGNKLSQEWVRAFIAKESIAYDGSGQTLLAPNSVADLATSILPQQEFLPQAGQITLSYFKKWCDNLSACLDVCVFQIKRGFVSIIEFQSNKVVESVVYFLNQLVLPPLTVKESGTSAIIQWLLIDKGFASAQAIASLFRSRAVLLCRVFVFLSILLDTPKADQLILNQAILITIASIALPGRIGIEDTEIASIYGAAGAGVFVPLTAASFLKTLSTKHLIARAVSLSFAQLGSAEISGLDFLTLGNALSSEVSKDVYKYSQPISISIRQWCSAIRAVSSAGLLQEVIVNSNRSDVAIPGSIQELAASLGAASFSLAWDAPPDMVDAAEDLLSLALDLGWPFEWAFENRLVGAVHIKDKHTMETYFPSLSSALGLQSHHMNELIDEESNDAVIFKRITFSKTTLSRFGQKLILPYILRADIYAAPLLQSVVPGKDLRLDPDQYPLLNLVFTNLLSSVTNSIDLSHKNVLRDHVWKLFHALTSAMNHSMVHETRILSQNKGESISSTFRIRTSTFINSILAFIPRLSPWVTQSPETQLALSSVLIKITKLDPWLLALLPQNDSSAIVSRGAQIRTLSIDAASVVVSLLKNATSSSFSPMSLLGLKEGDLGSEQRNVQRDIILQLLPFLLPGFSSTAPLPASTVNQQDTLGLDASDDKRRRLGQSSFLALSFIQKLVILDFPMRTAELVNDPLRKPELMRFKFTMSTLLTTLTATGSVFLLRVLSICFREGKKHIMMANIAGSLHALALSISPDGESPRALIREVFVTIFATKFNSGSPSKKNLAPSTLLDEDNVSSILCEHLAVPLLQRLSEQTLVDILTSKLFFSSFQKVIENQDAVLSSTYEDGCEPPALCGGGVLRGKTPSTLLHYLLDGILASAQKPQNVSSTTGAGISKLHCMRTHCRLNILAAAFDSLRDTSIKTKLYPVYKSELPVDENIKDNQLSLDVLRSCEALIRSGPLLAQEDLESSLFAASQVNLLRLRQAAYQLLLSCCLRTQTRMSVLYAYLFREDDAKPDRWFWHRLIDTDERCVDIHGLKPGGLPYLSASFAAKRTLASLSSFSPVTPLPDTLACTDAYAAGARAVASGASIGAGYGTFAGFAASDGPLSQALSFARVPNFPEEDEEQVKTPTRTRGNKFNVDIQLSQSLMAEGTETMNFSSTDDISTKRDSLLQKHAQHKDGSLAQLNESSSLDAGFVTPSIRAQLLSSPITTGGPSAQTLDVDYFNASPMMLPLLRMIDFIDASYTPPTPSHVSKTDSPTAPQLHMDTLTTAALPSSRETIRRVTFSSTLVTTAVNFDQPKLNGDPLALPPVPPSWMLVLLKRSSAPNPLPLRLFMARVVLNRPIIFKPFAQLWAPKLMRLILDLSSAAKAIALKGETPIMQSHVAFHYIMRDICRLLCVDWAWNSATDEESIKDAKKPDEELDNEDMYGYEPIVSLKKPEEDFEIKAARATNCFIPRSAEDKSLCELFLTHVIECSPTSNKSMLELHMRFFGVLIVHWSPFGIRFRRRKIAPLLQAKNFGRVHSSTMSVEGAKVAVASSAFWYASERAGQAMLDPSLDTPSSTSLNIDQFHTAIINRVQGSDLSRSQSDYSRFAMLLGTELKRAAQRLKGGRGFQPVGLQGDAVLLENADSMLERSFAASQTRSGVSTTERGIGQFLFTLSIIAQSYPSIISRSLLAKTLQPLARFTGRSQTRGKILVTILHIGKAAVISGRIKESEKREDIYIAFERYLPMLLNARVSSRARGASVQYYCLQLIGSLIPYLQVSDVASLFDDKSSCNLPLIFSNHSSRKCRALFFDVCEKLWSVKLKDDYKDSDEPAEKRLAPSADEIFASNGLNDIDIDDAMLPVSATEIDDVAEEDEDDGINTGTEFAKKVRVRKSHVSELSNKDRLQWVRSRLRSCLLSGLCDRDRDLRAKSYAFWNAPERLSAFLPKRFVQLSSAMFDSKDSSTEAWVHHAAPLILSLAGRGDTSDTFTSNTSIFPFALGGDGVEKPLFDANISVPKFGVSSGAGSLKPLFSQISSDARPDTIRLNRRGVGTPSSVSGAMSSATSSFYVGLAVGMVRATQRDQGGNIFSFTQHPQTDDHVSVLNPNNGKGQRSMKRGAAVQNSFAPEGMEIAGLSQQHVLYRADGRALIIEDMSSLAAGGGQNTRHGQSVQQIWSTLQQSQDKLVKSSSLIDKNMSIDDNDDNVRSPNILSRGGSISARDFAPSRKQFHDPISPISAEIISGSIDFGDPRLSAAIDASLHRKKKPSKTVMMTRAYRIGELPDIQISQKDLIFPLQSLCEADSKIAHITFSILFLATYAALPHTFADSFKSFSTSCKVDGTISHDLSVPQPSNKSQALVPSVDAFVVGDKRKRADMKVSSPKNNVVTRSVLLAGIKQMLRILCNVEESGSIEVPKETQTRNNVATPLVALLLDVLAGCQRLDHIAWAQTGAQTGNASLGSTQQQQVFPRETARQMRAFVVNPEIVGISGSSFSSQASSIRVLEDSLQSRGILASNKDAVSILLHKDGQQQKDSLSKKIITVPYAFGVSSIPSNAGTAKGLPNVNPPANPHLSLTSNVILLPSMSANPIESAEAWSQLKRLYSEIGDVDAVSSLASLTTASIHARNAYSFETAGDFKQAQTSFEDALTEWESTDFDASMSMDGDSSMASSSVRMTQFSQFPTQMSEAPSLTIERTSSASFLTAQTFQWHKLRSIMAQLRWRSAEEALNFAIKFEIDVKSLTSRGLASLSSEYRLLATRIMLHRATGEGNPLLALDFDDGDKIADELLESKMSSMGETSLAQTLRESNTAIITDALRLSSDEIKAALPTISSSVKSTSSSPPYRLFEAVALVLSGQTMSAFDIAKTGLEEAAAAFCAQSPLSRPGRLRSLSSLSPLAEIRDQLALSHTLQDAFASGGGSSLSNDAINEASSRFPSLFRDMCDRKTVFSGSRSNEGSNLSVLEKSFMWDDFILTRSILAFRSAQIINTASKRFPTSEKLEELRRIIPRITSAALRHTIASACLDATKSGARTQARALLRHLERVEDNSLSKDSRGLHSLTFSRLALGLRTANFEARMAEAASVVIEKDSRGINEALLKPGDVLLDALNFAEEALARLTVNDRRETYIRAFQNNIEVATDGLVAVASSLVLSRNWPDLGKKATERALLSNHLFGHQVMLADAHVAYASFAVSRESCNVEISSRPSDVENSFKEALKLLTACINGKLLYAPRKYEPQEKDLLSDVSACIGFSPSDDRSVAYVSLPQSELRNHSSRVSHCQLLMALLSDSVLRHMEDEDELSTSPTISEGDANFRKSLGVFGTVSRGKLASLIVESSLNSLSGETDTTLRTGDSRSQNKMKQKAVVIPARGLALSSVLDDSFSESNTTANRSISPTLLVPRLIELVLAHEEARTSFVSILKLGTGSFRSLYVFLPWISQIFAALHQSARPGTQELASLLLELALVYPQAVYYPLRMSNGMTLNNTLEAAGDIIDIIDPESRPRRVRELVAPVQAALAERLPLHDAFSRALEDLHSPELKVSDWINIVLQAISIHRSQVVKSLSAAEFEKVKNTDAARELRPEQQKSLYNCLVSQFINGRSVHNLRSEGSAIKKFWKTTSQLLSDLFKNGANVTSKPLEQLHLKIRKGDFSDERFKAPKLVSNLSSWLASFNASDYSSLTGSIEVPGQYDRYDGRTAPISSDGINRSVVSSHVQIVSVDPRMVTLASARRPKKISFIANDERVYSFLAKGGEDIRVDQRVQQLFRTSNNAFDSFSASSSRNLRLRTYSVIPVTPYIGLIEWIPRSIPLKVLIEREATSRLSVHSKSLGVRWQPIYSHANLERKRWMDSFISTGDEGSVMSKQNEEYRNCYRQGTGKHAEDAWISVMSYQPVDLLRSALIKMAPSPEGFLVVRASFLRSFACINVSGFIIGIGDRHLDNFLFTSIDASLIAIDFGVLFGAGSSTLSVPELIPFRLSSNLANVASPLPTLRILHTLMSSALSALQTETSKRSILTSMESFVNEPTLDWKLAALRKVSVPKNPSEIVEIGFIPTLSEGSWYPRAKLLIASLKLRRGNPGPLLLLELLQNQHIIPNRSRINDPKISTLVSGLRNVALGLHRETEHPRRHKENISSQFRLTRIEQALLETALGGPLTTNNALDVRLTVCKDAASQATCLIDLASDPNVLVRQYAGLCLWV